MGVKIPNTFRPITGFVCPIQFWPALGYFGAARYIAIYWEPGGDEAAFYDGRYGLVGANWQAYKLLLDTNFPTPTERSLAIKTQTGNSEQAPTHRLVIDSYTEWAWLAPADDAELFLRLQWEQYIFPLLVSASPGRPDVAALVRQQVLYQAAFLNELQERLITAGVSV